MQAGQLTNRLYRCREPSRTILNAGFQSRREISAEDVRKYAEEQGIAEEEVLKKGMEEWSRKITEKGSELYAKA